MSATVLHDSIPVAAVQTDAADRQQRFLELQARQLQAYGVEARSEYIRIADPPLRVHLLIAGEGEPVLFFHGGDGEAVDWAPLMAELQGSVQLIGVDRPSFGLSDHFDYTRLESPDLRGHAGRFVVSVLDALGLQRATLLGGSMGGFFALSAALDYPTRVSRIGLIGMPVGVLSDVGPELKQLCSSLEGARTFMQEAASLEAQHNQYRFMFHIDPASVPPAYFETRLAGLTLPGVQDSWATLLTKIVGPDGVHPGMYFGEELRGLRPPVLLIWGEHDMAPPEVGRAAAALIPDCRFVQMPGIGHFPFLEAPRRTADLLRALLDQPGRH